VVSPHSPSPLDDQVLSLGNRTHLHLDLCQSQDIRTGRHIAQDIADGRFSSGSREQTHGSDHEVLEGTVGVGGFGEVRGEIGDGGGFSERTGRGGEVSRLVEASGAGCEGGDKVVRRCVRG